jgi:hypothetical protein
MRSTNDVAIAAVIATAGLIAAVVPALLFAAERPPDLVASVDGEVRVRARHGIADATHHMYLQVDRAANGPGWDEDYDLGVLAGTNPVINTGVTVQVGDRLNVKAAASGGGTGLVLTYETDRDPRPGEASARIVDHDVHGTQRSCGGGPEGPVDVTDLYTSAVHLMSLSCWEDSFDWDFNDFVVAVDYTPQSVPTATPSATGVATPTDTPTATGPATATPTETPTATPTPVAYCVCADLWRRVPAVVIADALTQPERFYGWLYLLDPGKPPSPANPPRTCLSLHQVGLAYHPLWNKPEWRVGCP